MNTQIKYHLNNVNTNCNLNHSSPPKTLNSKKFINLNPTFKKNIGLTKNIYSPTFVLATEDKTTTIKKKHINFQTRSDSFSKIELTQHRQRFQQQQSSSPAILPKSGNANLNSNSNSSSNTFSTKSILKTTGITNSIPIVLCGFLQGDIFGSNYSLPMCHNNGELHYDPAHIVETGGNTHTTTTNGSA